MISYDIDPSLHTGEPEPQQLGDGFSPPHHGEHGRQEYFLDMATHPVEPEPEPGPEPFEPNPSHLPIEPEFGPMVPPVEPEEPRGKPPVL